MSARYEQPAAGRGQSVHAALEAFERAHRHPAGRGLSERRRVELAAAVAIRRHAEEWWARRGVEIAPYPAEE